MPKAAEMPTTSRRAVLAAAPGLILAAAVPAAAAVRSDDAELLATCARFDALELRIKALGDGPDAMPDGPDYERQRDLLMDQQDPLFERMCALRATTMAGLRARARSFDLWKEDTADYVGSPYWSDRMLETLMRDLTEGA